jgi:hypothetical protein
MVEKLFKISKFTCKTFIFTITAVTNTHLPTTRIKPSFLQDMPPNDPRKAAQDKLAREKKEQLQRQNSQSRIINAKYNDATNYIKVRFSKCKGN